MPVFEYCPETGQITRDGERVGTVGVNGYIVLRYEGRVVCAHRLAWFLTYGVWPVRVDHRNRVRSDNRLSNLRLATATENAQNKALTGPLPGAHYHSHSGRFKSAICVDGKQVHLGYFELPEAASEAYITAKRTYHAAWSEGNA